MPAHALKNSLIHWDNRMVLHQWFDHNSTPNSDEGPGDEIGEVDKLVFVASIYIDLLLWDYRRTLWL